MDQTITFNDLLEHAYSPDKHLSIPARALEKQILRDPDLREEYELIEATKAALDSLKCSPKKETIDKILDFAKNYDGKTDRLSKFDFCWN